MNNSIESYFDKVNDYPAYVLQKFNHDRIFNKTTAKLPDNKEEILALLRHLVIARSPESVSCDGHLSVHAISKKLRLLDEAWTWCESKLDRKYTEEDGYKLCMEAR